MNEKHNGLLVSNKQIPPKQAITSYPALPESLWLLASAFPPH